MNKEQKMIDAEKVWEDAERVRSGTRKRLADIDKRRLDKEQRRVATDKRQAYADRRRLAKERQMTLAKERKEVWSRAVEASEFFGCIDKGSRFEMMNNCQVLTGEVFSWMCSNFSRESALGLNDGKLDLNLFNAINKLFNLREELAYMFGLGFSFDQVMGILRNSSTEIDSAVISLVQLMKSVKIEELFVSSFINVEQITTLLQGTGLRSAEVLQTILMQDATAALKGFLAPRESGGVGLNMTQIMQMICDKETGTEGRFGRMAGLLNAQTLKGFRAITVPNSTGRFAFDLDPSYLVLICRRSECTALEVMKLLSSPKSLGQFYYALASRREGGIEFSSEDLICLTSGDVYGALKTLSLFEPRNTRDKLRKIAGSRAENGFGFTPRDLRLLCSSKGSIEEAVRVLTTDAVMKNLDILGGFCLPGCDIGYPCLETGTSAERQNIHFIMLQKNEKEREKSVLNISEITRALKGTEGRLGRLLDSLIKQFKEDISKKPLVRHKSMKNKCKEMYQQNQREFIQERKAERAQADLDVMKRIQDIIKANMSAASDESLDKSSDSEKLANIDKPSTSGVSRVVSKANSKKKVSKTLNDKGDSMEDACENIQKQRHQLIKIRKDKRAQAKFGVAQKAQEVDSKEEAMDINKPSTSGIEFGADLAMREDTIDMSKIMKAQTSKKLSAEDREAQSIQEAIRASVLVSAYGRTSGADLRGKRKLAFEEVSSSKVRNIDNSGVDNSRVDNSGASLVEAGVSSNAESAIKATIEAMDSDESNAVEAGRSWLTVQGLSEKEVDNVVFVDAKTGDTFDKYDAKAEVDNGIPSSESDYASPTAEVGLSSDSSELQNLDEKVAVVACDTIRVAAMTTGVLNIDDSSNSEVDNWAPAKKSFTERQDITQDITQGVSQGTSQGVAQEAEFSLAEYEAEMADNERLFASGLEYGSTPAEKSFAERQDLIQDLARSTTQEVGASSTKRDTTYDVKAGGDDKAFDLGFEYSAIPFEKSVFGGKGVNEVMVPLGDGFAAEQDLNEVIMQSPTWQDVVFDAEVEGINNTPVEDDAPNRQRDFCNARAKMDEVVKDKPTELSGLSQAIDDFTPPPPAIVESITAASKVAFVRAINPTQVYIASPETAAAAEAAVVAGIKGVPYPQSREVATQAGDALLSMSDTLNDTEKDSRSSYDEFLASSKEDLKLNEDLSAFVSSPLQDDNNFYDSLWKNSLRSTDSKKDVKRSIATSKVSPLAISSDSDDSNFYDSLWKNSSRSTDSKKDAKRSIATSKVSPLAISSDGGDSNSSLETHFKKEWSLPFAQYSSGTKSSQKEAFKQPFSGASCSKATQGASGDSLFSQREVGGGSAFRVVKKAQPNQNIDNTLYDGALSRLSSQELSRMSSATSTYSPCEMDSWLPSGTEYYPTSEDSSGETSEAGSCPSFGAGSYPFSKADSDQSSGAESYSPPQEFLQKSVGGVTGEAVGKSPVLPDNTMSALPSFETFYKKYTQGVAQQPTSWSCKSSDTASQGEVLSTTFPQGQESVSSLGGSSGSSSRTDSAGSHFWLSSRTDSAGSHFWLSSDLDSGEDCSADSRSSFKLDSYSPPVSPARLFSLPSIGRDDVEYFSALKGAAKVNYPAYSSEPSATQSHGQDGILDQFSSRFDLSYYMEPATTQNEEGKFGSLAQFAGAVDYSTNGAMSLATKVPLNRTGLVQSSVSEVEIEQFDALGQIDSPYREEPLTTKASRRKASSTQPYQR